MRRSFYGSTPIISISYSLHQPFQNRTIPLTFRNANICMCRYAFTSALSHSLFVMPTSIFAIRFHIRTILFAFRRGVGLPLPLHRLSPFPQPLQKDNTPSPCTTTLASLVKGRWIDDKAQTLTLLHLLAICSPFLY